MRVEKATESDMPAVLALLTGANLPLQGAAELADRFHVVRGVEGRIQAAGVVERHGAHGLLRSVVVNPELRGLGVGRLMVEVLIEESRREGLKSMYLLTETAPDFFTRLGFVDADRTEAPAEIRASDEFRSICPESARLMARWLTP